MNFARGAKPLVMAITPPATAIAAPAVADMALPLPQPVAMPDDRTPAAACTGGCGLPEKQFAGCCRLLDADADGGRYQAVRAPPENAQARAQNGGSDRGKHRATSGNCPPSRAAG